MNDGTYDEYQESEPLTVAEQVARYQPHLAESDWTPVQNFVRSITLEVADRVGYTTIHLLMALTQHAYLCRNYLGFEMLTIEQVFEPQVIVACVHMMDEGRSSRARRRAILFRMGEALGVIPIVDNGPALSGSLGSKPYSADFVESVRTHVELHAKPKAQQALHAITVLGFGAGLSGREILQARRADIDLETMTVHVTGESARQTPILQNWWQDAIEVVAAGSDHHFAVLSGVARFSNLIGNLTRTELTLPEPLTPQRMRATWLVEQMLYGWPVPTLLEISGIQNLDAFDRYRQYLPTQTVPES